MFVILEYTDEDYARMAERANINSRPIGEYIRKVTEYPCDRFTSCKVLDQLPTETRVIVKRKRRVNKKRTASKVCV